MPFPVERINRKVEKITLRNASSHCSSALPLEFFSLLLCGCPFNPLVIHNCLVSQLHWESFRIAAVRPKNLLWVVWMIPSVMTFYLGKSEQFILYRLLATGPKFGTLSRVSGCANCVPCLCFLAPPDEDCQISTAWTGAFGFCSNFIHLNVVCLCCAIPQNTVSEFLV